MTYMDDRERKIKIKELEERISKVKADKDFYKAMQLALKLTLNGSYGAFANKYFVISNGDIANAITAHGRDVNQYMMEKLEKHFFEKWHLDTDAHKNLGMEYICKKDGKYQAFTMDFTPLAWGEEELSDLLRHKGIDIEDLVENNFNHGDIEVLYEYRIWSFANVEPLDLDPVWIEEEGRPKYNGDNQIIIYGDTDSLYVSFTPIMKSVGFHNITDNEWGRRFILHVDTVYVKPMLNRMLDDYARQFGVESLHDFELETISKSSLFLKKKHYLNNVVWEDGVFYPEQSYYYPKGIEIIRSSTPPFVRKNIYRVINYLFSNADRVDIYEVLKIVKQIRKEFELTDIEEISMTTSCTNYNDKVIDDTESIICVKGAHFGVKAAALHNYSLNKNTEYKTKYDMVKSGRIKYYYCNNVKNPIFGYLRSFHPYEITEKENIKMDVDVQFEKSFLGIVNKFITPLGLPSINKRLSVLTGLFNF